MSEELAFKEFKQDKYVVSEKEVVEEAERCGRLKGLYEARALIESVWAHDMRRDDELTTIRDWFDNKVKSEQP